MAKFASNYRLKTKKSACKFFTMYSTYYLLYVVGKNGVYHQNIPHTTSDISISQRKRYNSIPPKTPI